MFRFNDPIYLWLLLIIPILVIVRLILWRQRKKKFKKVGQIKLIKSLMPDVSRVRPSLKFAILLFAISLTIIMLARPQIGTSISNEKRNGIETIIALDISNSMMAEDVVPSRLEKSKLMVENLINHFTNDKIGLVVFAGDAFVQLPITSDYVSAKMFLQDISPSLIATQGTDIAKALNISMNSFTQAEHVGKAIILITDGEDNEGGATEAAEKAKKSGINVFILGVGSSKGSPIPINGGGYLKDRRGQTVMTALNEQMCRDIARAGNGAYIHVDNNNDAENTLDHKLSVLQQGETNNLIYSDYNEQFQAIGIIIILLLITDVCIRESKNPITRHFRLFKRKE